MSKKKHQIIIELDEAQHYWLKQEAAIMGMRPSYFMFYILDCYMKEHRNKSSSAVFQEVKPC